MSIAIFKLRNPRRRNNESAGTARAEGIIFNNLTGCDIITMAALEK